MTRKKKTSPEDLLYQGDALERMKRARHRLNARERKQEAQICALTEMLEVLSARVRTIEDALEREAAGAPDPE